MACLDCHSDLKGVKDFPHESPLKAVDCSLCHDRAAREYAESVHALAGPASSGRLTVSCRDCHGTHEIKAGDDFDSPVFPFNLPATCEKCHLEKVKTGKGPEFIRQYRESVHFKALDRSGLTISANCSSCHSSHGTRKVADPLSLVSRKNIIQTCGLCHEGIRRDYLEGVHGKDYVKGASKTCRSVPTVTANTTSCLPRT